MPQTKTENGVTKLAADASLYKAIAVAAGIIRFVVGGCRVLCRGVLPRVQAPLCGTKAEVSARPRQSVVLCMSAIRRGCDRKPQRRHEHNNSHLECPKVREYNKVVPNLLRGDVKCLLQSTRAIFLRLGPSTRRAIVKTGRRAYEVRIDSFGLHPLQRRLLASVMVSRASSCSTSFAHQPNLPGCAQRCRGRLRTASIENLSAPHARDRMRKRAGRCADQPNGMFFSSLKRLLLREPCPCPGRMREC